jgi:hypothetical protein
VDTNSLFRWFQEVLEESREGVCVKQVTSVGNWSSVLLETLWETMDHA